MSRISPPRRGWPRRFWRRSRRQGCHDRGHRRGHARQKSDDGRGPIGTRPAPAPPSAGAFAPPGPGAGLCHRGMQTVLERRLRNGRGKAVPFRIRPKRASAQHRSLQIGEHRRHRGFVRRAQAALGQKPRHQLAGRHIKGRVARGRAVGHDPVGCVRRTATGCRQLPPAVPQVRPCVRTTAGGLSVPGGCSARSSPRCATSSCKSRCSGG